jgi:hypothetical protein
MACFWGGMAREGDGVWLGGKGLIWGFNGGVRGWIGVWSMEGFERGLGRYGGLVGLFWSPVWAIFGVFNGGRGVHGN